jgi:hypothetical protein
MGLLWLRQTTATRIGFFGQRSRPNQSGGRSPAHREADGFAKSNQRNAEKNKKK